MKRFGPGAAGIGFATVRAEGTWRIYAVDACPLAAVDAWLERFREFWGPRLEALATEIERGKRARKTRRTVSTSRRQTPSAGGEGAPARLSVLR